MIKIHKEGKHIIAFTGVALLVVNLLLNLLFSLPALICIFIGTVSILKFVFILRFFRKPDRIFHYDENVIFSPADGRIVAIEEVFEPEYYKDKRKLVSVFMSVWNVHINWYPVTGIVKYFKYHPGKYLVARHPKSSELNERTTLVLADDRDREVLVRQIAGIVARRIVYYPEEGNNVSAGSEMGFIRFGSRLDVYLPLSSKVLVKYGDTVKGKISQLAEWQ